MRGKIPIIKSVLPKQVYCFFGCTLCLNGVGGTVVTEQVWSWSWLLERLFSPPGVKAMGSPPCRQRLTFVHLHLSSLHFVSNILCADLHDLHPLKPPPTPLPCLSLIRGGSLLDQCGLNSEGPGLASAAVSMWPNRVGGEGSLEALVLTRKASVILPLFRNMNFETPLQRVSAATLIRSLGQIHLNCFEIGYSKFNKNKPAWWYSCGISTHPAG